MYGVSYMCDPFESWLLMQAQHSPYHLRHHVLACSESEKSARVYSEGIRWFYLYLPSPQQLHAVLSMQSSCGSRQNAKPLL
jgi:hypothetical protein